VEGTTNKGRTWIGYVCPGCRTVFRVAADFEGKEVICPSCEESLKLPENPEEAPPLVMSPQESAPLPTTEHPRGGPVAESAPPPPRMTARPARMKLALALLIPMAAVIAALLIFPNRKSEQAPRQTTAHAEVSNASTATSGPGSEPPVIAPQAQDPAPGPADDPAVPEIADTPPPPSLPENIEVVENQPPEPAIDPPSPAVPDIPGIPEVPPVPTLPDPEEGLVAAIPDTPENRQPAARPPVPADDGSGLIHTVQRGDTLSRIARLYEVDLAEIQLANDLTGDLLLVGQQLRIPGAKVPVEESPDPPPPAPETEESADPPPAPPATRSHTVVRGDTLSRIARQYDCDPAEIKRLNRMRNDIVRLGAELIIPPPAE